MEAKIGSRRNVFIKDGSTLIQCNKCKKFLSTDDYYIVRNYFISKCKPCCAEYHRKNPSKIEIKRKQEAKHRRDQWLNSKRKCIECGSKKTIKEWPRQPNGRLSKTCCKAAKLKENEQLSKIGKKRCWSCEQIKDLSCFGIHSGTGKPRGSCLDCIKSSQALKASRERRQLYIEKTDDGTLTKDSIRNLFGSNKRCPVCDHLMKRDEKHLDHIIPLSKGGSHSISNAMILCSDCNSSKSASHPKDWFQSLTKTEQLSLLEALRGRPEVDVDSLFFC